MRVGIDAHYLGHRQSGNETYVRNLIAGFASVDGDNTYSVYVTDRSVLEDPPVVAHNIEYRYLHPSPLVRIPFGLPAELHRHPVDVLQAHYNAPLVVPCRLVLVVHDISWALHPELFPFVKGRQIALRAKVDVKKAARIIVDSHAMKLQVVEYYGLPDDKVAVIPLGVDPRFGPSDADREEAAARVAARHGIAAPYLLFVGDLQPRKNLPTLLEAFARLKSAGLDHRLAIVGKKAWDFDAVFSAVEHLGLQDDVVFTGYVPDEDLVGLYRAASVFVYPSIYEGFGLPPLEAMACGLPVAASDEPSLKETVGDAATLFDPTDPSSIADAVAALVEDRALWECARARGLARAAEFSWDSSARKVLEVYREVVGTGGVA